ncbi:MAG TPA: hypothetical protein VGC79_21655 [Polyangiaceae bacterium]
MDSKTIAKALIIDDNSIRVQSLEADLRRAFVEPELKADAVKQSGAGCGIENLVGTDGSLPEFDMLFLHLGPPEGSVRSASGPRGNECSMEFFQHHLPRLAGRCVIAYSGSSLKAAPRGFDRADPAWHVYVPKVLRAIALQIVPFVHIWRQNPSEPPPFSALTSPFKSAIAFRALVAAYHKSYQRLLDHDSNACAQREVPELWNGVFASDSDSDGLVKRLAWEGDETACRAATLVKMWLDTAGRQGGFPAEVREAILAMRAWPSTIVGAER